MHNVEHTPNRLLAIDDSVLIHRLLKAHLLHDAIELHSAMDGRSGLDVARSLQPGVILLDLELSDFDGLAVLAELKDDARTKDIPVIFTSASCSIEDRVRALDMGAADFIAKPFHVSELLARVRSALRVTRLIRLLAQRAQLDGLTGLWNRAFFDERLEQEVSAALRHGHDLSLIMADIDHFKRVNDSLGHPYGDRVLEEFATILQQGRASDIACRYGGEEFAIILPHIDAEHAGAVADRVRQLLQDHTWPGEPDLSITASFGVAELRDCPGSDTASLIHAGDRALYQAKQSGRNVVVVSDGKPDRLKTRLSA